MVLHWEVLCTAPEKRWSSILQEKWCTHKLVSNIIISVTVIRYTFQVFWYQQCKSSCCFFYNEPRTDNTLGKEKWSLSVSDKKDFVPKVLGRRCFRYFFFFGTQVLIYTSEPLHAFLYITFGKLKKKS